MALFSLIDEDGQLIVLNDMNHYGLKRRKEFRYKELPRAGTRNQAPLFMPTKSTSPIFIPQKNFHQGVINANADLSLFARQGEIKPIYSLIPTDASIFVTTKDLTRYHEANRISTSNTET
jgi:hypothetical protein